MDVSLKLYFSTDENKNTSITIPNAATTYDAADIKAAMLNMSQNSVIKNKQGILNKAVKAKLYKVTTVPYDI